ncbi:NAD(P)H-dependent oxidoreductase [Peribacillus loiseleuriae]|uniref:NAD(P)H-dependent oxidoreductase n=1 Tax=Peribacillus loiseleuriae TaxID=1679170 RepID=UPI00382EE8AD
MNFKAVADRDDFNTLQNESFFKYAIEQKYAAKTNRFPQDIQEEQEKLLWANFIIFQFPLWWYSVPAILKGWSDRVFASGFVYSKDMILVDSEVEKRCYPLQQDLLNRRIYLENLLYIDGKADFSLTASQIKMIVEQTAFCVTSPNRNLGNPRYIKT